MDVSPDETLCTADACVASGAAVVAVTDTGGAVGVATAVDFSGDDVVAAAVGNRAGVEVVTGGGILTVFTAVAGGAVEAECSLEGAVAATGGGAWTSSAGGDVAAATVSALAAAATLADEAGVGTARGLAEDTPGTGTADSCPCVAT